MSLPSIITTWKDSYDAISSLSSKPDLGFKNLLHPRGTHSLTNTISVVSIEFG